MTTFTTEDRLNASPPHVVDSGASVNARHTARELSHLLEQDLDLVICINSSLPEHLIRAAKLLRQQEEQIAILEQQRDAYKEAHEALLANNLSKSFNVSE